MFWPSYLWCKAAVTVSIADIALSVTLALRRASGFKLLLHQILVSGTNLQVVYNSILNWGGIPLLTFKAHPKTLQLLSVRFLHFQLIVADLHTVHILWRHVKCHMLYVYHMSQFTCHLSSSGPLTSPNTSQRGPSSHCSLSLIFHKTISFLRRWINENLK